MCGIIGTLGHRGNYDPTQMLNSIRHRGPDGWGCVTEVALTLGHTRLAIIDPDPRSVQPMRRGNATIAFNGELWNYRDVRAWLEEAGYEFTTASDTEVVATALDAWAEGALKIFEGMFAIAWWDHGTEALTLIRDRFGEIPLHVADDDLFGSVADVAFASEKKALRQITTNQIEWVEPGWLIEYAPHPLGGWVRTDRQWYDAPIVPWPIDRPEASFILRAELERSVRERSMSDVPVCALVSGGVDSTVVLYELVKHYPNLTAYTAVMDPRSRDLKCARDACRAYGVDLVEVRVDVPTEDDMREIVRSIEMPYKAQVEIAYACDVLAARIAADGFKVVFSGEGSDELWASYGFAYHALQGVYAGTDPDPFKFAKYRKGIFLEQHRKNFARCNKIFMAHGIECRLPFLHRRVVELALGMEVGVVMDQKPNGKPSRPKAVLYDAYADVLPDSIMDRPKVAFQDGMGLKDAIANVIPSPRKSYMGWHIEAQA